jgi:hypothetical protein
MGSARSLIPVVALAFAGQPLTAQILEEWRLLHSDTAFDYLVTDRGFSHTRTEVDGTRHFRVVASRMLVRYVDRTRTALVVRRGEAGRPVRGYTDYASSTYILDIDCMKSLITVREAADYADNGVVLDRMRWEDDAGEPVDWPRSATSAVTSWACRNSTPRAPPGT